MDEIFRMSFEVVEYEDGNVEIRCLYPDGPLKEFYGMMLGPGQTAKLGLKILKGSALWNLFDWDIPKEVIEPERPQAITELQRLRRRWERNRSKLAPMVFDRYGEMCVVCGVTDNITIDHIIPLSGGGTNELTNLQPLCRSCNSRKGTG